MKRNEGLISVNCSYIFSAKTGISSSSSSSSSGINGIIVILVITMLL
jgi:hypothetical protein